MVDSLVAQKNLRKTLEFPQDSTGENLLRCPSQREDQRREDSEEVKLSKALRSKGGETITG
jgi:hypothetical protein